MQPAPTPYWPAVVVPVFPHMPAARSREPVLPRDERTRAKDSRASGRPSAGVTFGARMAGPTLTFMGVAMSILGMSLLFATCIAGMG